MLSYTKNIVRSLIPQFKLTLSNQKPNCKDQTQATKQQKFDCSSCSKKLIHPQCNSCERFVNYFKIFNIPQQYKVDEKTIQQIAKDLQKQFHPDRYHHQKLEEKMVQYSSYINEAKSTLLNDLQRAIYLMSLKGVKMEENIEIGDKHFMMDIFQIQEEIEDANVEQAKAIKKRIEAILANIQKDLQDFFLQDDLNKCKDFIGKYKYLHRALVNVNQKISPDSQ